MQGPRRTIRRAALPLLLAAALAATGCGGGSHDNDRAAASRPTTTTTRPTPATTAPRQIAATVPTTTAPAPAPAPVRYVCPEGGIAEVKTLQRSVDQGHQPWLLSAEDVALTCALHGKGGTVTPAGDHRYRVTETGTGRTVLVTLAQPLGPGTIWVATSVT